MEPQEQVEPAVEPEPNEPEIEVPHFEEMPVAGKPRFMTVGQHFYAQTDEGELRIRLAFKTKFIRKMRDSDKDELEQLFEILEMSGEANIIEKIDELDIFDTVDLVQAFFAAFEKKQKLRLGELSRSSSS